VAAGIPISRLIVTVRVLTATVIARSYRWRPADGLVQTTYDWAERDLGIYERSPIKVIHETRQWVDLKMSETPDETFGVVPDLRAEGITHYVALPIEFANGTVNAMTIATDDPGGFDADMLKIVRMVLPAFTAAVELRSLDAIMRDVLAIYVGAEPARRILSGTVHRGEINRISSAIMFVDMRDFTRRTQNMSAEETADLLNRYYDCVVPHVEANGGSVLKFIGDGILAIFPDGDRGAEAATRDALAAALAALAAVPSACPSGKAPFEIGIALHHGNAAYGNVGSGERLDFTVVGRDVNLTDRVGRLNKKLGIALLLSEAFVRQLDSPVESCGHHAVASFDDVIEVFQPV
jgi:adenylate cyclase